MKGYGKRHYHDEECHVMWHLTAENKKKSWAVYRTFTPFSKRRHRFLTTNKARERRNNRFAGYFALKEY